MSYNDTNVNNLLTVAGEWEELSKFIAKSRRVMKKIDAIDFALEILEEKSIREAPDSSIKDEVGTPLSDPAMKSLVDSIKTVLRDENQAMLGIMSDSTGQMLLKDNVKH